MLTIQLLSEWFLGSAGCYAIIKILCFGGDEIPRDANTFYMFLSQGLSALALSVFQ